MRNREEVIAVAKPVLIAEMFTALFIVGIVLLMLRNGS